MLYPPEGASRYIDGVGLVFVRFGAYRTVLQSRGKNSRTVAQDVTLGSAIDDSASRF
jgi:hypothetical protein